ncbi:hypothetical protein HN709_00500 [Candidatus Peregrinibacteria bacterium]|jgi:hypothetical protein|nr:hypothetical protein [Candidatus Peregrinibacteria bacterium]MBT7736148.1 hypothetical protein [Candidatus Peregrinibacteria bacterium]
MSTDKGPGLGPVVGTDIPVQIEEVVTQDVAINTVEGFKDALLAALPEGVPVNRRALRVLGQMQKDSSEMQRWLQEAPLDQIQSRIRNLSLHAQSEADGGVEIEYDFITTGEKPTPRHPGADDQFMGNPGWGASTYQDQMHTGRNPEQE